jgi:hypothetical protein
MPKRAEDVEAKPAEVPQTLPLDVVPTPIPTAKTAEPATVVPQSEKKPASSPALKPVAKTIKPIEADADGKYLLRYHFSSGESVRWHVEHRAKIVTTVQDATQSAETVTKSVKVWRVVETLPGGEAKFVHLISSIDMKQKLTGRAEVSYNSETDADVPPIFADAAKQIGVPLAEVTIDTRGNVLKREDKQPRPEGSPSNTIALVLPDKPLGIGESWTAPFDLTANDKSGQPKVVKARHKLTLEKVEGDLATLRNETQILSPVEDPTVEAQVVQAEQSGTVSFDLRRGRIVAQESDLDKQVFGFQGPESKLHYAAQFRESLDDAAAPKTATAPGEEKSAR